LYPTTLFHRRWLRSDGQEKLLESQVPYHPLPPKVVEIQSCGFLE
jgi:hypothetical protein